MVTGSWSVGRTAPAWSRSGDVLGVLGQVRRVLVGGRQIGPQRRDRRQTTMSPPVPFPAKFSGTFGLASR